jgi:hypothetical protein
MQRTGKLVSWEVIHLCRRERHSQNCFVVFSGCIDQIAFNNTWPHCHSLFVLSVYPRPSCNNQLNLIRHVLLVVAPIKRMPFKVVFPSRCWFFLLPRLDRIVLSLTRTFLKSILIGHFNHYLSYRLVFTRLEAVH